MRHNNSVAEANRADREGLYRPSRPTTTHDRPRHHTATHDRPRTDYQRRQVCLDTSHCEVLPVVSSYIMIALVHGLL